MATLMCNSCCVHIICTKWPVDVLVRQEAHTRSKSEADRQLSRSTLKRKGPVQTKATSKQGSVGWATASEGIVDIESQMALTQEQSLSFLFMFAALIDKNKVQKERLGRFLWSSHLRGADSPDWGAPVYRTLGKAQEPPTYTLFLTGVTSLTLPSLSWEAINLWKKGLS